MEEKPLGKSEGHRKNSIPLDLDPCFREGFAGIPDRKRSKPESEDSQSPFAASSDCLSEAENMSTENDMPAEEISRQKMREILAAAADSRSIARKNQSTSKNQESKRTEVQSIPSQLEFDPSEKLNNTNLHLKQATEKVSEITESFAVSSCAHDSITQAESNNLCKLVFGESVSDQQLAQWSNQGFNFSVHEETIWGLVQSEGGPCGVLAPVQAIILKHILFGENSRPSHERFHAFAEQDDSVQSLNFDYEHRTRCLVKALAECLWVAGQSRQAAVAIVWSSGVQEGIASWNSGGDQTKLATALSGISLHIPSSLPSVLRVLRFNSLPKLEEKIAAFLPLFQTNLGVLLMLFSVLLSRTLEGVAEDRDDQTEPLITQPFGHVSQEVVNLLLCGHAVTNLFDGEKNLEEGFRLKGIPGPVQVGFLTLMEFLGYCDVGSFLKNPRWPVWVVGSDSHYTVLFGLSLSVNGGEEEGETMDSKRDRIKLEFDSMDASGGGGFIARDRISSLLERQGIQFDEGTKHSFMSSEFIVWSDFVEELRKLGEAKGGLAGLPGKGETSRHFDLFHFNGILKFDVGQTGGGEAGDAGTRDFSRQRPRLTKIRVTIPACWSPAPQMEFQSRLPIIDLTEEDDMGPNYAESTWQGAVNPVLPDVPEKHAPLVDCIRTKWPTASCFWEGDAPSVV